MFKFLKRIKELEARLGKLVDRINRLETKHKAKPEPKKVSKAKKKVKK